MKVETMNYLYIIYSQYQALIYKTKISSQVLTALGRLSALDY